jgi:hypothetical protein
MTVIKPISSLPLFSYHFYAQILSSSNLPRTKSGYKNVYSVRVSCGIASAETRKVRVVLSPSLMGSRCPVHCALLGRLEPLVVGLALPCPLRFARPLSLSSRPARK